MTVELTRKYDLSAAHHLPRAPEGHKCRGLHGHSYQIEVLVRGDVDPDSGWLMDYGDIDRHVRPLLAELDHWPSWITELSTISPVSRTPPAKSSAAGSGNV
jgi:6-pyruvoyltetrahydropterin/6-carboxytetrahydropterin synthase